jgi:CRISPR/Cas system-associated protein Csm6
MTRKNVQLEMREVCAAAHIAAMKCERNRRPPSSADMTLVELIESEDERISQELAAIEWAIIKSASRKAPTKYFSSKASAVSPS